MYNNVDNNTIDVETVFEDEQEDTTMNNTNTTTMTQEEIKANMETMQDASITVYSKEEANEIVNCAAGINVKSEMSYGSDENGNLCVTVTLKKISDEDLSRLEKRIGFAKMGNAIVRISNKVTDTLSDIGDFALNDALVPAATAAGKATMRTAGITGVAGARIIGSITSSAISEASTAAFRLASDPIIHQAGKDLKLAGRTLKKGAGTLFNYLTGVNSSSTKFKRC